MSLPAPPWRVAGRAVHLVKCAADRTLTIAFAPPHFDGMTDEQIVELVSFTDELRQRFEKVVPEGWRVLA